VVVAGLRPFTADLVEQLVRAEVEEATVVRVPAGEALPGPDPGAAVLVVTASAGGAGPSPASGLTPVSVVSLDPVSGLASSHPLADEPIPIGELTPALLRWLAEGAP
jgi:hypothetical protein